jgi:hypothetical protein
MRKIRRYRSGVREQRDAPAGEARQRGALREQAFDSEFQGSSSAKAAA